MLAWHSSSPSSAQLLDFNPAQRMDIETALRHPYMKAFVTNTEPRCGAMMSVPIDDDHKFTVNDYRERLYQTVVANKKDKAARMRFYFGGGGS